jgi:hypothetical protein
MRSRRSASAADLMPWPTSASATLSSADPRIGPPVSSAISCAGVQRRCWTASATARAANAYWISPLTQAVVGSTVVRWTATNPTLCRLRFAGIREGVDELGLRSQESVAAQRCRRGDHCATAGIEKGGHVTLTGGGRSRDSQIDTGQQPLPLASRAATPLQHVANHPAPDGLTARHDLVLAYENSCQRCAVEPRHVRVHLRPCPKVRIGCRQSRTRSR